MQKVTICGKQDVLHRWKEYLSDLPNKDIKKKTHTHTHIHTPTHTHTHTHSNAKKSTQNTNSLALQVRKKYYKQMISLQRI